MQQECNLLFKLHSWQSWDLSKFGISAVPSPSFFHPVPYDRHRDHLSALVVTIDKSSTIPRIHHAQDIKVFHIALFGVNTLHMLENVVGDISGHDLCHMPLLGSPLRPHQGSGISDGIDTFKAFDLIVFIGHDKSCIAQWQS